MTFYAYTREGGYLGLCGVYTRFGVIVLPGALKRQQRQAATPFLVWDVIFSCNLNDTTLYIYIGLV